MDVLLFAALQLFGYVVPAQEVKTPEKAPTEVIIVIEKESK